MNRLVLIVMVLTLAVFGGTQISQAQDAGKDNPCAADVAKLCKGGESSPAKCLKDHQKELSQGCKGFLASMHGQMQSFKEGCKSDIAKFCKDVKSGDGKVLDCLKQHEAELSGTCKPYLATPAMPKKKQAR
jgi:hypothetical protein